MKTHERGYITPIAIIVAGALVALGLFYGLRNSQTPTDNLPSVGAPEVVDTTSNVREVTKDDHIKGSLDAAVKIVEYSDFECPFCQRFHGTMNGIMNEFGSSGEVAWVFRQFPLDQLHPRNARKAAVASECVNELGGKDAFWKFTDGYFELTATNDQTNLNEVLPILVKRAGVNKKKFDECVVSGKFDAHVQADVDNAVSTGGRGTPWSIVIAPNGKTFPLNGAQSIETVRQLIEIAKKER